MALNKKKIPENEKGSRSNSSVDRVLRKKNLQITRKGGKGPNPNVTRELTPNDLKKARMGDRGGPQQEILQCWGAPLGESSAKSRWVLSGGRGRTRRLRPGGVPSVWRGGRT